jgi:hypothetical protein
MKKFLTALALLTAISNVVLAADTNFLSTLGGSTPDPLANATAEQVSPDEVAVNIPTVPNKEANVGSLFVGLDFKF